MGHSNSKSGVRHKTRAMNVKSGPSLVTMVWSGGSDWLTSKAQIVALASAPPDSFSNFKPWNYTSNQPTTQQTSGVPGKVILSIGGSSASSTGWLNMASGGTAAWLTYFQSMFKETGLQGVDWDLESLPTDATSQTTVYTFVGELSKLLKASNFIVTFTIFANPGNPGFPPASFLTAYAGACDYIALMCYNNGQYVDDTRASYGSWCMYAAKGIAALPAALQGKVLYALYPKGGVYSCCAPCMQQAVDFIRAGKGVGVAFWCEGGWNGSCGNGKGIVSAWVDILNLGGGNGVADFEVAYPNSACMDNIPGVTGPTQAMTSYNGCGYNYACDSTKACVQQQSGQYHTSDCGGACSGTTTTTYACVAGVCQQSPNGPYTDSNCGSGCGVQPQTYACSGNMCKVATNGPYTDVNCGPGCGQASQMYACFGSECKTSDTGTYTEFTCGDSCVAAPSCSTLGMSTSTGQCASVAAKFTCNGTTRCCCSGMVPSPSATNPTSCVLQQ